RGVEQRTQAADARQVRPHDMDMRVDHGVASPPLLARWAGKAMSLLEQGHAGGEAVDEVLSADRAEFALREEAGQRNVAGFGAKDAGVVVRFGEQARAAAVAAEQ